jgi:uncharacterized protein
MKIYIDIYHLPQFNLFKNAIIQLGSDHVDLGCVNRGKLVDVIRHECPEFNLFVFGDYNNNTGIISLATKVIIPRIIQLVKLFRRKKYQIIGAAGYQANVAAKILGIPNFAILDDPRGFMIKLLKLSTKEIYLPPFAKNYGKIKQYNALKEWAYLSPKYFIPSENVLEEYDLKKKGYVFIREVSTETINYLSQEKEIILKISNLFPQNIKVVLSLENKNKRQSYPDDWIILNEPVSDIHSLMYYSKIVISTGDSMAREGGMLGVPSIYLGNRDMPANRILIDKGLLQRKSSKNLTAYIENKILANTSNFEQNKLRNKLENEWDDITKLIMSLIEKGKKQ